MANEIPEFVEVGNPLEGAPEYKRFGTKDAIQAGAVGLLAGGLTYLLHNKPNKKDPEYKKKQLKRILWATGAGTGAALLAGVAKAGYNIYRGQDFSHTYKTKFEGNPKAIHYFIAGAGASDPEQSSGYVTEARLASGGKTDRSVLINFNDIPYALQHMREVHKNHPDMEIYIDATSRGVPKAVELIRQAGKFDIPVKRLVARDGVYRSADMTKPNNLEKYIQIRPVKRPLRNKNGILQTGNLWANLGGAHNSEVDKFYDEVYTPYGDAINWMGHHEVGEIDLNSPRLRRIR